MTAMNTNITSQYEDMVSQSSLVQPGSPAVYHLKSKKEEIETLMKMTFGERNLNKVNKNILLVGETGAGKSALVNALLNYTMGVKFEDNIWFEIVEREISSQTESQTSDVIMYEIFGFEDQTLPYSLTIIDTPGFGDTRGIEHDAKVSQRLLDLFRPHDGIHEINAVCLVMKASENRLSDRLRYVIDSIVSLFGKDVEKNIVALITHADGGKPKNALEALKNVNTIWAKTGKNEPVYFLFNNKQTEDRTEDPEHLEYADRITQRGLSQFKDFLDKAAPQKLKITVEVLNKRLRLTACVQNLDERIKEIELKQEEIKQIQEALRKHEEEIKKYKTFTIEVDEVYKDKVNFDVGKWRLLNKGAVCCNNCEETCHYPCTIIKTPEHCRVFKKGFCSVCTNKCPASAHVKEKSRFVTKTRKVQKNVQAIKDEYEKNIKTKGHNLSLLKILENHEKDLIKMKNQLLDESYEHIKKLEQIALNVHSLSTFVHLEFLIKKMKEKGDKEKLQKLEEMWSRVDEGTKAALRYKKVEETAVEKSDKKAQ